MEELKRNDPCHCGSGKKYKKCCMEKDELQQIEAPKIEQHNISIEKKESEEEPWLGNELEHMSTEEIIDQLKEYGVKFTREQFLKDVKVFKSADDLSEDWFEKFNVTAEGPDEDFLWYACLELWERLAPDYVYAEKIDREILCGYDLFESKNDEEACRLWLQSWNWLKQFADDGVDDFADVASEFDGIDLEVWCQDIEMELGNVARENSAYHYKRIDFCKEFCARFQASDSQIIQKMKLAIAETIFILGKTGAAEKKFQEMAKEFDSVWIYARWGDLYRDEQFSNHPKDIVKAKEIYEMGLGKNLEEENVLKNRISQLKN